MNIYYRIISVFLFIILFTSVSFSQGIGTGSENDFKLSAHITSGINYTYESNSTVSGTYKKNSIPLLGGIEFFYKDTYGFEITSGYFPVMFYSNVRQYQRTDVTIDASLIAYPVTFSLKYKLWRFSLSLGGSFCMLKTDINLSNSGTETVHNSFGFSGALSYYMNLSNSFRISPRISFYHIPDVASSTVSFQIRLLYTLFEF
jgi:hypothetical protein